MHLRTSSHAAVPALGLAALTLLVSAPAARAQTQDLFVSNSISNTISRFAGTGPGTFSTNASTLSDPNGTLRAPQGLAVDAGGDLLVANATGNSTTEFASTGKGMLGPGVTVETGLSGPEGLAVDAGGDLFAANFNTDTITGFASTGPGTFSTKPTTLPDPSGDPLIPAQPEGLAFDAGGNLFVANANSYNIVEFASTGAGTFGAGKVVVPNAYGAHSLAFDAGGDLFVTDVSGITEFASTGAGTFGTGQTIALGLNEPVGLAFDAGGDLFVADNGTNSVVEFASTGVGTFGTGQTVETGLSGPTFLAFRPSAPPAIPEASTTVSFGLLLALGLGGLAVAAKRKKASG